jgi:hypothetical protein
MTETIHVVDVPDDSILASKQLTVRAIEKMKLKHLRAFQRVVAAGKSADMEDMALALSGALVGWSLDEVNELTLDEMMLVIEELNRTQQNAVPNGNGSSFTPPTERAI